MRKGLFWLNDKQWALIEPHLPANQTGPVRDDDRRIISGIIHMLQCGARWRDCPPDYGPYTTIYNRFNRWAKRGHWQAIFEALARCGKDSVALSIDSTSIKAHRSASTRLLPAELTVPLAALVIGIALSRISARLMPKRAGRFGVRCLRSPVTRTTASRCISATAVRAADGPQKSTR